MVETPTQTSPEEEMVIGSNLLVINGYSAANGIAVGKYILSEVFTAGGYKWAIHFYPYGKQTDHNPAYVGMYVVLATNDASVEAKFELTLIDQSGKGKHRIFTCFDSSLPQKMKFKREWGYKHFFRRAMLEKSDYFADDCVKIYCTVGVVSAIDRSRLPSSIQVSERLCSFTEMMSESNLFTIQGYSMVKGISAGKHIASHEFWAGGYKWVMYFYPNARLGDNSGYISMFIKLASEGKDVQVQIELMLMDQSGKGNHMMYRVFNNSLPLTFKCTDSMWGYERFFRRGALEKSDYLRDDCLKIYFNVGVFVSSINSSRSCSIQVPEFNMGLHFSVLLKNMEGSDIRFNVSDEKIHAHKLILAARSPKLCSELLEGVNTEEVMVPDMEPKVFRALLHFIYTDTLAEKKVIASAPSVAGSVTAKLLAVGNRYDLERLKRLCESHLCNYITVNSAIQVLVLADRYHAAELKDVCLKFAASNLTAVMCCVRYEYREENWTSLKCELLNAVGGFDEDCT